MGQEILSGSSGRASANHRADGRLMQGPAVMNGRFRTEAEEAQHEKHVFDVGHGRISLDPQQWIAVISRLRL